MKVYRVERHKYIESALSGMGAAKSSGFRWNGINTPMVYTSESRSLATLEVSVHLDLSEDLPNDRYYLVIEIPDNLVIQELKLEDLPDDWNAKPPTHFTQSIGDDFAFQNQAAVLKVPSSIVPQEFNYLINPSHRDARHIKIVSTTPMNFDKRFKHIEK